MFSLINLKKIIFSVLLTLTLIIEAKNYEFNNLIVFGDSLSDVGSYGFIDTENNFLTSKMIAGNNKIYNEYLAKIFTGKEILPSNQGGTNYAYTNSLVNPMGSKQMIDIAVMNIFNKYLSNNKINSKNLYIIWAGGNDLANNIIISFPLHILFSKIDSVINILLPEEEKIFENPKETNSFIANKYIASMTNNLINNNAKYIIVPNLFDSSLVPQLLVVPQIIINSLSSFILDINGQNELLKTRYLLPFGLNKKMFNIIRQSINFITQLDYNVLNKNNNIPQFNNSGKELIHNAQKNLNKRYGLGSIIVQLSNFISDLTVNFNYFLEQELQNLNDHIVYIDMYKLFNEIIDNPKLYGIDDILLPTCFGFMDANNINCKNEKQGIYQQQKTYLFSDLVHPSGFMHKVFAQYIESVFNAPVLVSSISRHLASINTNSNDYVNNTLFDLKTYNDNVLLPFASISGIISKIGAPYNYNSKTTNTNSLNVGFTYVLNPKLIIGAMLSSSYGSLKPFDNFRYRYNSQIINLFSKYILNHNWWVNTNFNLGRIGADNIRRTIQLGKATRLEQSRTSGKSIGVVLTTGYDIEYNNNITLTPIISLNLHNYQISAFSEKANTSTAMRYAKSSTTYKELFVALRATKVSDSLNSFIQLGLNSSIHNKAIKIKSGLKSTKISFIREINPTNKPSLNLGLGLNKKLNHNLNLTTSLNYKINANKNQQLDYVFSIKYNF